MTRRQRLLTCAIAGWCCWSQTGSGQEARGRLIAYLDGLANARLEQRQTVVAALRSSREADARKKTVRETVLRLIGGLPERKGPVAVKAFGTIEGQGSDREDRIRESARILGHGELVPSGGKRAVSGRNRRAGARGRGKAGGLQLGREFCAQRDRDAGVRSVGAGRAAAVFRRGGEQVEGRQSHGRARRGEHSADADWRRRGAVHGERCDARHRLPGGAERYRRGADRSIRVLGGRDGDGVPGGSGRSREGGGERLLHHFVSGTAAIGDGGTGGGTEHPALHRTIEQGLDFGDWVEAFAPKPYAIVSTTNDMFPFEGARQTYEEAKRFYSLYGAADRLEWITGPGGHGNLGPIGQPIIAFFVKHLKGSSAEATFTPVRPERREDLQCTPTGQVATAFEGETVYSLNRKRADAIIAARKPAGARLASEIRRLTGAARQPWSAVPEMNVTATEQRAGYKVERLTMRSDGETEVAGLIAVPDGAAGNPAVLMFGAANEDVESLAKAGKIVLALEPRPEPAGSESIKSPYLGSYNLLSLRAFLVGKSIVGLRVDDIIRAMDWLTARKDLNRSAITG